MTAGATRIAMWSGPRNISTAMMRAFGNRPDCHVVDEPFYAAYLQLTGLNHPLAGEIIADGETDPAVVIRSLIGPVPDDRPVFYQKHMTHHMVPQIDRGWFDHVRHAFLIRRPENVLASYVAKRQDVDLRDIGFVEQADIFDRVADHAGAPPPVIDAYDVLRDPPGMLQALCRSLGITYTDTMLTWPPGRRATDGVWAKHWYGAVEASTGFGPPSEPADFDSLPDNLKPIATQARTYYERLYTARLLPDRSSTINSKEIG